MKKNKIAIRKVGRPGKFKTHVLPKLEEIEEWISAGVTEATVAKCLGIHPDTFRQYKKEYSEFSGVLTRARETQVEVVAGALFRRCMGYNEDIGGGKKVHVPADVNAIKFFLINRKPEEWRDKFSYEHTTSDLPAMLEEAFARAKKAREEGN